MAQRARRYDAVIAWPLGRLGLRLQDEALAAVDFLPARARLRAPANAAARRACAQLTAYLRDPRAVLELPLATAGTGFQRRVWTALRRIPPGAVLSYGELARRLRSSARAVGGACRANPVPVLVPCHRVVAARDLGGFMGRRGGAALRIKRWLLAHEAGR